MIQEDRNYTNQEVTPTIGNVTNIVFNYVIHSLNLLHVYIMSGLFMFIIITKS